MYRHKELKSWLTEIGVLYGAVIVFISLSFLLARLDTFLAGGHPASPSPTAKYEWPSPYADYSR